MSEDDLTVGVVLKILKQYPTDYTITLHDYEPVIQIRDRKGNIIESMGCGD